MDNNLIAAYDRELDELKALRETYFTRDKRGKRVLIEGKEEAVLALDKKVNELINFDFYDKVVVGFSGGKDSMACVLNLLERGLDKSKLILWHHDIDGREGNDLMDWPVTRDYCRKFAELIGVPLRFSWKAGGFEREMLRSNTPTAEIYFESEDGELIKGKTRPSNKRSKPCTVCGKLECYGCRQKFPQVTANLAQRWCTAYLKIDVGCKAFTGQDAFKHKRTLFVTGERALESGCRAHYAQAENHKSDLRNGKTNRHIEHIRPIHKWDEAKVWEIIRRWNIKPHPCYYAGWGRCSCAACIFGKNDQWASLNVVAPKQAERIIDYEKQFDVTIDHKLSVPERIEAGEVYTDAKPESENTRQLMATEYTEDMSPETWELPSGAFSEKPGELGP